MNRHQIPSDTNHRMPAKRMNCEALPSPIDLEGGGDVGRASSARRTLGTLSDDAVRAHRLATLGTLAASLAHEVNNILTPVLSYAQLALASPQDAELTRKALVRAVDCTAKAAQIGSAMLGFVRVEGAHSGAAGCTVNRAVSDAVACLGRDLAKDGVEFRCRVDPVHAVAMDHVSLQQVVLNLLLNAREAMRGRRGSIEIESSVASESTEAGAVPGGGGMNVPVPADGCSTGNIKLMVRDTGPGMAPVLLERLFVPFVSSRASVAGGSERTTGTGLGLSVCRFLVERAGGRITVQSHAGVGTMFEIVLPVAGDSAKAVAA